jgi:CRP/FNR family transcriptional regulator, cyclic AMP receptor protein
MVLKIDDKIALLRGVALFRELDEQALQAIVDQVRELQFPAGQYVVREGDVGTGCYLIVSGQVRVVHHGKEVAVRGPGEYFGELAVLDRSTRSAHVITTEPTMCLALASWEVDKVLELHPRVAVALLREMARRVRVLSDGAPY